MSQNGFLEREKAKKMKFSREKKIPEFYGLSKGSDFEEAFSANDVGQFRDSHPSTPQFDSGVFRPVWCSCFWPKLLD